MTLQSPLIALFRARNGTPRALREWQHEADADVHHAERLPVRGGLGSALALRSVDRTFQDADPTAARRCFFSEQTRDCRESINEDEAEIQQTSDSPLSRLVEYCKYVKSPVDYCKLNQIDTIVFIDLHDAVSDEFQRGLLMEIDDGSESECELNSNYSCIPEIDAAPSSDMPQLNSRISEVVANICPPVFRLATKYQAIVQMSTADRTSLEEYLSEVNVHDVADPDAFVHAVNFVLRLCHLRIKTPRGNFGVLNVQRAKGSSRAYIRFHSSAGMETGVGKTRIKLVEFDDCRTSAARLATPEL